MCPRSSPVGLVSWERQDRVHFPREHGQPPPPGSSHPTHTCLLGDGPVLSLLGQSSRHRPGWLRAVFENLLSRVLVSFRASPSAIPCQQHNTEGGSRGPRSIRWLSGNSPSNMCLASLLTGFLWLRLPASPLHCMSPVSDIPLSKEGAGPHLQSQAISHGECLLS